MADLMIKNWTKFQHYRDRNPPWIKLHYEILNSRDWICLDDDSKLLAIVCMLIGSRNDGKIPVDPAYIQEVGRLKKKTKLQPLVDAGFLIDDSNVLASASVVLAKKPVTAPKIDRFEYFWKEYPKKVGKGDAIKAWKRIGADDDLARKMLREIKRQSASEDWQKDGGKFIPHPATWLRAERWSDEPTAVPHIKPYDKRPEVLDMPDMTEEQRLANLKRVKELLNGGNL